MFAAIQTDTSQSDAGLRSTFDARPLEQPATRILVVDAHFLIREALREAVKKMTGDVSLIEATGGHQALRLVSEQSEIDLILLELDLPDRDGLSVLAELHQRYPAIPVVMFSARHDRESVNRALALGASGFIPKSEQREVMLSALELVLAGGVYIPSEILLLEDAAPLRPNLMQVDGRAVTLADLGLTERQIDVLQLVMQGKSNKAICRELKLAEPTVKNHVTAILKVLKVHNRTQAVLAVHDLREGRQSGPPSRIGRRA